MAYIYHGPNEPVDFPEQEFQKWYGGWSRKLGLNPNPDDPNHHYDYRAAFSAGAAPDPETNHWPSQFKAVDHPNRIVDGIDTLTGKPVPKGGYIYRGADPDYGPQPEPDERRSLPGDIAAALAGGLVDLVEMGAQAARHGQAPEEAPVSTKIIEGARSLQEAYPVLRPSVEAQTSEPRRWIYEGTRMAIPSLGAGLPGGVGGFLVGGFPGAAIGAGTTGAAVFGVAEYDTFLEEVREYEKATGQKLDPDLVHSKALKTAFVEGGFEGAANMLDVVAAKMGGRALEPLKAIVRKHTKTGAKEMTELTAKGALHMDKPGKEAVKALAGTMAVSTPTEVGTEMAQSYFETKFRNDVGLKAGDPIEAAKDVIGPTVVMTFLFGLGATGFNHRTRKMHAEALSDPKASPQDRVNAIRAVNAELGRYDKKNGTKYAEQWANDSLRAVQEGRAIGIDENVLRKYGPTPDKPKREPGAADVSKPGNIITGEGTPPPGAPPGGAGGPAAAPAETFANTGVIYSENIPAGVEEPAPIIPEQEPEQIADEFSEDQLDEILSNETNTEPSEAQVQAGNYKKGHMKLHGLDISIESPKGSVRKGVDKSGKPWENEIKHHYGYIRGTVGKDKDHLDVFLGPNLESTTAYVINQKDPETGKFDEHKIMMGFNSREEAEQGYLDNYEEGWQGLGSMVETSMDEFKAWAKGAETKKPFPETKAPSGEAISEVKGEKRGISDEVIPPEVLATFKNDETGMESTVRKLKDGRFSVQLKDLDSGNTLPTSHIYPDEKRAIEDAQKIAGVKTSLKTPEVAPEEPKDSTIPEKTEEAKGAEAEKTAAPKRRAGKSTTVRTEAGTKAEVQYAVVDAADLITSHDTDLSPNENYPQELQPRDRERAASREQILRILSGLDPELLGENPKASDGAPVVGSDNVVESGNGRTIALKLGYEKGHDRAKGYKKWLSVNAERFGLDKRAIESLDNPVLVRVRTSEIDRVKFAQEANVSGQAAMSPVEIAVNDAKILIDPSILAEIEITTSGDINTAKNTRIIRDFISRVAGKSEIGNYVTKEGLLSQAAITRMRNAMFAAAYGNTSALEVISESIDDDARNISRGLLIAAPAIARVKVKALKGAAENVDITPLIVKAAEKYRSIKESGETVEEYLGQLTMFGGMDPATSDILKMFEENKRSGIRIGKILKSYADLWDNLGDPRQALVFGKSERPEPMELFGRAKEIVANEEGKGPSLNLFQDQAVSGQKAENPSQVQAEPEEQPETVAPAASLKPELTIEDYSDKSFVVRGNTKEHKDRIKAAGKGIFSIKLKGGPGWVFGLKQKDKVREALKDLLGETPSKQIEKQEELPKKAPAPVQPKAEGGSPAVQGGASVQEKTAEHRRDLERKGTTRVGGIGYTIQQADTGHYYYTRTEKGIRVEHGGAGYNVWSREKAIEEALGEISHDLQVEALRRKPAAEEKKPEPREEQPVDKYTGQAGKTYYVDGKPVTLQPRKPGNKNPTYRFWGDAQEISVRYESGMTGYVHHSELRETPEAEALKKKPADKVVGQKTPDLRKGIDLTVTGQRRNLPGNEDLWYTVHKNRDGVFVVTIGKHDSEYDFARIYGEGDTAEAAYKRAVGQLRKDIRAKAAPVAEGEEQKPKHDIQAELDSMSDDDIYSMLGVENPEKATPSPAPQEKKTAAGIAKKAGVESLSAVQEGMKALGELFGGANKLSMGLTFDEETYAKAKPHFQKMWAHAKEAGYTLKELVDHIIAQFGEAVKPYVARFMIEQKTGSKPLDKGEDVDIISEGVKDGATVTDTRQQAEGSVEHDRDRAEGPGSENLPGSEAPGQAPGVPRKPRAGDDGELRSAGDRGEGEGAEHEKPQPKSGTRTRRGASSGVGGNAGSVAGVQRPGRELNHRIEPGGITRQGSWKDAARNNLDAIEIVKTLERENRLATPEEKAKLVKYVGWGASELANKMFPGFNYYGEIRPSYGDSEWTPLVERMVELLTPEEIKTAARSTQYAHYTSEPVIRSIYTALERFGFTGGNIIEPGMGIGHFAGMIPDSMNNVSVYTGIEMDHTTAAIAKALYPGHNIIQGDFTKEKFPRDFFDLAIGNPPFSDTQILADPEYKKHRFMLHDYFFAKSIDRVRPGGLLVFITSKGTMDKVADKARRYLADRADLIGAIRMPQTAFKQHAGTEVVTDTIFLQKRMEGQEPGGETWMDLAEVQTDEGPTNINEYFARHPEMVLGRHALQGSMYRANMYTVLPKDGNMEDHFAEAIGNLPEKVYSPTAVLTGPEVQERVIERDFNPKNRLEGGLYVADDGTLMSVEHGSGVPATSVHKLSAKDTAWLKDYCALRDALKQAHYDQLNDGEWKTSLKALQRAYDAFVKKNGPINKFTTSTRKETDEDGKECTVEVRRYVNERFSKYDAEFSKVWTLEEIADSGKIKKGPPLLGRVVEKPKPPEITSVPDALAVCLDQRGRLDLDHVAALSGVSRDEAIASLGSLIYDEPGSGHLMADEYLSGDVVKKLEEAAVAAEHDPKYKRNVEALQAAQPVPLTPDKISVNIGAPWVPLDYYTEFAKEVLGLTSMEVHHDPRDNRWSVAQETEESSSHYYRRRRSRSFKPQSLRSDLNEWGTADRGPNEILDAQLNGMPIKITRTVREGSSTKTYTDEPATAQVNEVAKKMRQRFKAWVWEDAERAADLLDIYNKNYNNLVGRKFDGTHLTLPGVSLHFKLHDHQKRAIWRVLQAGNTYLAHAVGSGKTIEMIAAGMEMKRLGMISKPLYIVPNHMLQQFATEFGQLYPLANIMVADEKNFHTDNRRRFVAQAALNKPDAVIMTHSSFGKLMLKKENVEPITDQFLQDMRASLEEMAGEGLAKVRLKQMESRIEKAEQRFDSLIAPEGKDTAVTFEEMGVDFLFVDEAHEFRKLDFTSNRQVKGITPEGSKRAMDLYLKILWLNGKNTGRSFVFASGTPITNTMGELFTLMRFFDMPQMEADGTNHFDAWANMFGSVSPEAEMNAAGRYELVERFARFENVPELMGRVRTFMDVLTSSQLGAFVTRPDIKGGSPEVVITPPSEELRAYQKNVLEPRIESSKKWKPTPGEKGNPDPIINIITDGRLASIDLRFVMSGMQNDPDSKLNKYIDGIIASWEETRDNTYVDPVTGKEEPIKGGAIICFYNHGFGAGVARRGFDAKAWVAQRFKDAGIPSKEIAWIDDLKNSTEKQNAYSAMREGKVRILLGSAKKMGTGLNVQRRLAALHYLDPPWYPSDVEQPDGRILRQGNLNKVVTIRRYATKGSYDATMWQMVARKQRMIDQAFSGDASVRSIEDLSETSQYQMAAALASGDERIVKMVNLNARMESLSRLQEAHHSDQVHLVKERAHAKESIGRLGAVVKEYKAASRLVGGYVREIVGRIGNASFDNRHDFGAALIDAANKANADRKKGDKYQALGTLNGFEIGTAFDGPDFLIRITVTEKVSRGLGPYKKQVGEDVSREGLVTSMVNFMNGLDSQIAKFEESVREHETTIKRADKKIDAPFAHAQELAEVTAEIHQIEAELLAEGQTQDEIAAAQTVEEMPTSLEGDASASAQEQEPGAEFGSLHRSAPQKVTPAKMFPAKTEPWMTEDGYLVGHDHAWMVKKDFVPGPYMNRAENNGIINKTVTASGVLSRVEGVEPNEVTYKFSVDPAEGEDSKAGPLAILEDSEGNWTIVKDQYVAFILESIPGATFRAYGEENPVVVYSGDAVAGIFMPYANAGVVLASRGESGKKGRLRAVGRQKTIPMVSREQIIAALALILKRWKNHPDITVVDSISELPAGLRRQAIAAGAITGAFYNDTVYLVADGIGSIDEAYKTILHETVGHWGLRKTLGPGFDSFLSRLYADIDKARLQPIAEQYGLDLSRRSDQLVCMEEYLALLAEKGEKPSVWKRFIAWVRSWLMNMGFKLGASQNDVNMLIASAIGKARRYVQDGKGYAVEGFVGGEPLLRSVESIQRANRTSRGYGAVGSKAITPRYVESIASPSDKILDFGAGKGAVHAADLRENGLNVTAYDFGSNVRDGIHDPDALSREYDIVYASNVLNVQSGKEDLIETLEEIASAVRTGGRAVFNFPGSPRFLDMDAVGLAGEIRKVFGNAPVRVGGTKAAPLFEVVKNGKGQKAVFRKAEAQTGEPLDTKSLFPEVQTRMEKARGLGKQGSVKDRALAKLEETWHSWRRHFPQLDPAKHGKFINILRLFEAVPNYSKTRARDNIKDILGKMNDREYDVFSFNVILEDLMKDLDSGLLDPENLPDGETLPFGYTSRAQVEQDLAHFMAQAAKSKAVSDALARRNEYVQQMRADLVHHGLLDKSKLNDPAYFHHQVLEMWALRKWTGSGVGTKDVRTHKKGWQIARTGSLRDYNTEYIESEFEVLAQGIAQIETKKTMDRIDREANIIKSLRGRARAWNESRALEIFEEKGLVEIVESQETGEIKRVTPFTPLEKQIAVGFSRLHEMASEGILEGNDEFSDVIDSLAEEGENSRVFGYLAWLLKNDAPGAMEAARIFKGIKGKEALIKSTLGDQLKTFRDLIPEGYAEWKPEPGSAWYLTNSITDKVLDQIRSGERSFDDQETRKILARGVDAVWVVPEELAATLSDFRAYKDEGPLGKASQFLISSWKQWVLINPFRVFKYNLNNMSGDFDICWAYDPKIIKNYMWKAGKDLLKYVRNQDLSPELKEELDTAFRKDVLGSGMTVHDITDITEHMALDGYLDVMAGRKVNAISRFWNTSKKYTTYRENILRLASYRYFKDRLAKGEKAYGASNRDIVDSIRNRDDRAALLARELVGDYGNLTVSGQWLRTKMIPFYSWCVPDYTEILTREGWKTYDQLRVGEEALTYNLQKRTTEWQRIQDKAAYPFDGDLVTLQNAYGFKYQFTEDHRVVIIEKYKDQRKVVLAKDLKTHQHIPLVSPHEFTGESVLSETDAALLGWLVTDGYFRVRAKSPNSFEAMLYQKKPSCVDLIRSTFAEYISSESVHPDTGVICFRLKASKLDKIRKVFKSKDDLPGIATQLGERACQAMYDAMLAAEGTSANGFVAFPQNNGPVLDAFQILCYMLGKAGHIRPKTCKGKEQHSLYVKKGDKIQLSKWKNTREHYNGMVWCPKTESGTWIMRQNGKVMITGNCEINAPRYVRMFYNLPIEGEGRGNMAEALTMKMARKTVGLTAKAFTLYGMVVLWNMTVAPLLCGGDDPEEELSDFERRQLHLILGRREDGSILTVRFQGALSDALAWFGLEGFPRDIKDLSSGKKTGVEQAKEMFAATPNRIVNASHPFIKMAAEELTGYSTFPDIFHPRPIRDKVEHLARMFSLDSPYRHFMGKPTRGDWTAGQFWDDVINLVGYSSDPGEAAYFDTRSRARSFMERKGVNPGYFHADSNSKSAALYNYKRALQYGDLDVAKKFLDKYMDLGGSRKGLKISVRLASPEAWVPKKYRAEFRNSLMKSDLEKYNRAMKWYREVYGGQ